VISLHCRGALVAVADDTTTKLTTSMNGGRRRGELDLTAHLNKIGVPMMTEERTRFEALLEEIQTHVKVIAEGHGALVQRMDRLEARFGGLETRFDKLEIRFDVLEHRFNEFTGDTQQRLERIETHLQLNGSSDSPPRQKAPSHGSVKHRKKE
jgi:predicted nuclease with TOPRIM domain